MRTTGCAAFLIIAVLLGSGASAAKDANDAALAATLRKLVEESYAAHARGNVDEAMGFIDSRSPGYDKTKKALPGQFQLGTTTKLVYYRYIGHDDEFAVARVKFETTVKPGTSFVENVVDTMTVFHQEGGQWKFWDQLTLGVVTR